MKMGRGEEEVVGGKLEVLGGECTWSGLEEGNPGRLKGKFESSC